MKIRDMGRIDAPVMVFGGVYSNLQALEALEALGHPAAQMICTGDVVAYCADPVAVCVRMQALEAAGAHLFAGNVERQLGAGALDCGCGFEAGTTCDLLSAGWYGYANAQVDTDLRGWLRGLPDIGLMTHHGQRYAVLHGGATDVSRFLWPTSPEQVFEEEVAALRNLVGPINGVIAGHCGIPFEREVAGVHWVNAGVIGMPPHDGHPATRYLMLEEGAVRIKRLSYNWQGARDRMRAEGLTQGYHDALKTGFWPSEDVLPPSMRRSPGRGPGPTRTPDVLRS